VIAKSQTSACGTASGDNKGHHEAYSMTKDADKTNILSQQQPTGVTTPDMSPTKCIYHLTTYLPKCMKSAWTVQQLVDSSMSPTSVN
jgi:hypothetical protein